MNLTFFLSFLIQSTDSFYSIFMSMWELWTLKGLFLDFQSLILFVFLYQNINLSKWSMQYQQKEKKHFSLFYFFTSSYSSIIYFLFKPNSISVWIDIDFISTFADVFSFFSLIALLLLICIEIEFIFIYENFCLISSAILIYILTWHISFGSSIFFC